MSATVTDLITVDSEANVRLLHYARHDDPSLSPCGVRIAPPRVYFFSQDEVCPQCVELMLDWIDLLRSQGREPLGSPYAFQERI